MSADNICSETDGAAAAAAFCIVCDPRGAQLPPSSETLVAANEHQLMELLTAHDADFTLCVVPLDRASEVCCSSNLLAAETYQTRIGLRLLSDPPFPRVSTICCV